jgi:hypothetical protein
MLPVCISFKQPFSHLSSSYSTPAEHIIYILENFGWVLQPFGIIADQFWT